MVTQKVRVTSTSVISAVEDADNYTSFMPDSYIEKSVLIQRSSEFMDVYHLLDLPFVSNRHYIYRMARTVDPSRGRVRLDWILIPRESEYADFMDSMDVEHGHPIYLDTSVGGWDIIPLSNGEIDLIYRIYADPAGRLPNFLVSKSNRVAARGVVGDMIREAKRRDKRD